MYENLLADVPTDLWIGGKWRKASDGGRFDVLDPATENKIASVASATVEDAKAAVDAASEAFPGWAAKKPRERAEVLRKSFDLIMRDSERLAKLITIENGKALSDSRGEVAYAAEFFRWYAEEAVRAIGALSRAPASGARIVVQHKPARRRMPGGAQARLRHAAHHAGADADPGGGGRAGGRGQRHPLALLRQGGERHAA
jgi:succinate-semialdehyde dehydrogenase / glutarate-semialdehyde dehydrogenase